MSNPYEAPSRDDLPPAGPRGPRVRHGCTSVWLWLMVVLNALTALVNLGMSEQLQRTLPDMPSWAPYLLALLGAANVAFAVMLLRWKKLGFMGVVATSLVGVVINLMSGVPPAQLLGGLVGVGILYAVLQMGTPSAWSQLE